MRIKIEEINNEAEEEIVFRTHEMNPELFRLLSQLKLYQNNLIGYKGEEIHRITLNDIFYFEVVDNNAFIKTEKEYYDSKLKLYEFEQLSLNTPFFRCSKSMVLNSLMISYIRPSLSGRFEAILANGERVEVSRQYVSTLKRKFYFDYSIDNEKEITFPVTASISASYSKPLL